MRVLDEGQRQIFVKTSGGAFVSVSPNAFNSQTTHPQMPL